MYVSTHSEREESDAESFADDSRWPGYYDGMGSGMCMEPKMT